MGIDYDYEGEVDERGQPHGFGVVKLDQMTGSYCKGFWLDGEQHGLCKWLSKFPLRFYLCVFRLREFP